MSLQKVKTLVPQLNSKLVKGNSGRIGVVGGSLEYTGAPYFSAISALKTGADLCHVICTPEAATVIKTYSPELIVHPLLKSREQLSTIEKLLNRIDVLVIGPGLGRDSTILEICSQIIKAARNLNIPLIIDAVTKILSRMDYSLCNKILQ
jgi:ATP-dependent NAD(P)H-hydrate dehydratase